MAKEMFAPSPELTDERERKKVHIFKSYHTIGETRTSSQSYIKNESCHLHEGFAVPAVLPPD
jgi:hypothetical protein